MILGSPTLLPATFPIWPRAWPPTLPSPHGGTEPAATAQALRRRELSGEWPTGTDLRAALPLISVPTLVVHSVRNVFVPIEHGRYLAEHIPNAQLVELDSADHVPWASEADIPGEIEEFLTGTRKLPPSSRILATVLFTDIVGSTEHASNLGDRSWKDLLENHDRAVERQLRRYGGQLVKHTGDGVLEISTALPEPCNALARSGKPYSSWACRFGQVSIRVKSNAAATTYPG